MRKGPKGEGKRGLTARNEARWILFHRTHLERDGCEKGREAVEEEVNGPPERLVVGGRCWEALRTREGDPGAELGW